MEERMTLEQTSFRGRMLIYCPDRRGVVAAVSHFLFEQGANLIDLDQHTDPTEGCFFMRVEFDLPELGQRLPALSAAFAPVAREFSMSWSMTRADPPKRVAIFVSRQDHCLLELLWQWRAGDFRAEIAMVISNHEDLRGILEPYGIPFHWVPVAKENKREAEARHEQLLKNVDLVVLARYMQILSPQFVDAFPNRIINIHHSFLPAFVGANPYARAYERGVKLIGATAHYVTAELDAGPIIDQDVKPVGHRDDVEALKRIGRQIERVVLARAVAWHLEDRVLIHGNRTVVFT
jgi:formyltetrahydrofolate deformylase